MQFLCALPPCVNYVEADCEKLCNKICTQLALLSNSLMYYFTMVMIVKFKLEYFATLTAHIRPYISMISCIVNW